MVSSRPGSPTMIGWNLLSSAASLSTYFRYSSRVVAPMHCNSPRVSTGFKIFAASIAPSAAPAPTRVCISSIKRIISPLCRISSSTFFIRSSNSPRYLEPATMEPRSSVTTLLLRRISGTSPLTIFWASPSTIAVFPTPGSPIKTGLFFVRRERTWITRSISFSRPITGSSLPILASSVRSRPNWFNVWVLFWPPENFPGNPAGIPPPSRRITCFLAFSISAPIFFRTCAATPSPSRISPKRMCSVPT